MTKQELENKGLKLIPMSEIEINHNPDRTTGYDFTVDDYYTFATADGVFVQDSMAIYFPVTEDATQDVYEGIGIWKNLISPTDLTIVPRPNQDIILGIWAASTSQNPETVEFKGKKLPFEQYILNTCFPKDYPVQTKPMTKSRVMAILNDIVFKYPPNMVMETLDKLKRLGFMMSTIQGYTLGLDDLYSEELEDVARNLTGDITIDMEKMKSDDVMKVMKSLPVAEFIDSGARGSWDQTKQLVLARGYVSDSSGRIMEKPIKNSFVSGLTQEEFFRSSWGARKGLLDTALSTGDSGYLTRQLIYSTINIELDPEIEDCGTTDGLELLIENPKIAKTLLWRNYINEDGTLTKIRRKSHRDLVGKKIKLRSPIYCKNPKICKKCYGDLYKILHSNQIGIIATHAVAERTTQLVLKSFHLSGTALVSTKEENKGKQDDIVSGMTLAQKIFHDPDSIKVQSPATLTKEIFDLFNPYKPIQMVHYEILVASMMWKDGKPWRTQKNRITGDFEWVSILKVPSYSSWLLGAAFSSLKNKLLDGVIKNRVDVPSSLTELFRL